MSAYDFQADLDLVRNNKRPLFPKLFEERIKAEAAKERAKRTSKCQTPEDRKSPVEIREISSQEIYAPRRAALT